MEPEKQCKYCDKFFPPDAFGVALTTPTRVYRRRKCRDCYRTTKQTLIGRYFDWINQQKEEKGCMRCGIKDPRVLDFHHVNGKDKLFGIGGFRRAVGFEQIKKEIEKCEVVCANCHRIVHDEQRREKRGIVYR